MNYHNFFVVLATMTEDISKYLWPSIQNSVYESPIFSKFAPEIHCSLLTVHYLLVITHYLLLKFQSANQEAENILYDQ